MESHKYELTILYILSFVGDFTNSLFTTVTIIYATINGASTIEVGWIGAAFGLTYLFAPVVIGRIVDRISRKQSLLIGTGGQIGVGLFYFLTPRTPLYFIIAHLILGIIYGFFWPAVEAKISDLTENMISPRAHELGFFNFCVAWGIGYAIGPWVAGFLAESLLSVSYLLGIGLYFGGFLFAIFGLENGEKSFYKTQKRNNSIISSESTSIINNLTASHTVIRQNNEEARLKLSIVLLFVVLVNTSTVKMFIAYFPNYAARPEGLGWDPQLIGNVALAFGLARFLFFIVGRVWRVHFRLFIPAFSIVLVILIITPLLRDPFLLGIGFIIAGFFLGLNYIYAINLTMQIETNSKGTKAGLFESCVGIGSSLSPVLAGFLASISFVFPFYIYAACLFGVVIILILNVKNPILSAIENIK